MRVLAEPGKQYAIYLNGGKQADLKLDIRAGTYIVDWIDTRRREKWPGATSCLTGEGSPP